MSRNDGKFVPLADASGSAPATPQVPPVTPNPSSSGGGSGGGGGIPSGFTSRSLTDADNGNTLVPSNNAQTVTLNTGMVTGFGCYVAGHATVDGNANISDRRATVTSNPNFAIVQVGVDAYHLVGSKL